MEIPASFFFWVCCAIGYTFSALGLDATRKTLMLSDSESMVMSLFEFFIIASSSCLILYVIVLHPHCGLVAVDSGSHSMLPITERTEKNIFIFSKSKVKRWVEFAVGMAGTILFLNFFRLTSFHQVVAFLYFAVAWLANTVLVSVSYDLGVFNFLLANVIVGCTVSEYGLRGTTWIAYGVAVVLYGLRLKLESVALVNREGKGSQVVIW